MIKGGRSFLWMGSISVLQFGLGVFLVIIRDPISMGSIHQMGAFFLLSATVIDSLDSRSAETRSACHQLRQSGRLLNRREVAPLKLLECRFGQLVASLIWVGGVSQSFKPAVTNTGTSMV